MGAAAIFTTVSAGNKSKWTRAQDEVLTKMASEGKSRAEISKATGHPENSITYRIRFVKKTEQDYNDAQALKAEGDRVPLETVGDILDLIKY